MNSPHLPRLTFIYACIFLTLGVLIGAFGAHGAKNLIDSSRLTTFETGVRYHFYHALGLLLIGIIQKLYPEMNLKASVYALAIGILLFSFNCYIYALSGQKIFALIVPFGGVLFALGWLIMLTKIIKIDSKSNERQ